MNLKEDMHSTLIRRLRYWGADPVVLDQAADILERWYDAEFMSDEEVRQMNNDEFYDDVLDLAFAASDTREANIVRKALGETPYTEKADKNTHAGAYETKSNHFEAPEKKKSKKLDLSVGDVVALNPNSAWSPDPKKATGLYAIVTAIKTDDTVSVEAENGAVYKLFDINQFAKIKESFEDEQDRAEVKNAAKDNNKNALANFGAGMARTSPAIETAANLAGIDTSKERTSPAWVSDMKQRATFYVGQDKYDVQEILNLMAKEYNTTPEKVADITGLGRKQEADKEHDEDYYFSEKDLKEGVTVKLDPKVSENIEGDVGVIKSITEKYLLVEIKDQGVVPTLKTDIVGIITEGLEDQGDSDIDGIIMDLVFRVAHKAGKSPDEVLEIYTPEDILDAYDMHKGNVNRASSELANGILEDEELNDYGEPVNNMGTLYSDNPMLSKGQK